MDVSRLPVELNILLTRDLILQKFDFIPMRLLDTLQVLIPTNEWPLGTDPTDGTGQLLKPSCPAFLNQSPISAWFDMAVDAREGRVEVIGDDIHDLASTVDLLEKRPIAYRWQVGIDENQEVAVQLRGACGSAAVMNDPASLWVAVNVPSILLCSCPSTLRLVGTSSSLYQYRLDPRIYFNDGDAPDQVSCVLDWLSNDGLQPIEKDLFTLANHLPQEVIVGHSTGANANRPWRPVPEPVFNFSDAAVAANTANAPRTKAPSGTKYASNMGLVSSIFPNVSDPGTKILLSFSYSNSSFSKLKQRSDLILLPPPLSIYFIILLFPTYSPGFIFPLLAFVKLSLTLFSLSQMKDYLS